ncbi:hypothetical protein ACM66B_006393 [Microbotryomycetes sp. NB124-2]
MTDASQLLNLLRGIPSAPTTATTHASSAPALSPPAVSPPPQASSAMNEVDRLFATFAAQHPSAGQSSVSQVSQVGTLSLQAPVASPSSALPSSPGNSLLSLLQRMGSPASPPPPAPSHPSPRSPPLPGPQPRKSLDASALLAQMSQPPPAASTPAASPPPPANGDIDPPSVPLTKASTPSQAPKFAAFVSPFDALEQSYAKDKASKALKQAASDQESNRSTPVNPPRDTLSPVSGTRLATGSVASSDAGDLTPSHVPASPALKGKAPARQSMLASSYLPSPASESASNGPSGLRLPRNDTIAQVLTIDVSDDLRDSLLTDPVKTTPVALFNVELKRPQGQIVGLSNRSFTYTTSKGRARVIDKDSGTRILLKAHKTELIDLQVAKNAGPEGTRAIATVAQDDKLILWAVPDHCTEETAGFTRTPELSTEFLGSNEHWRVVRLHPHFPEVPVIVAGTSKGTGVVLSAPLKLDTQFNTDDVRVTKLGDSPVVDIDFSPDGTAFAALTMDGQVMICSTANPRDVLVTRKSIVADKPATAVRLLANHTCRPSALALLSDEGRHGQLVSLHQIKDARQPATIEFLSPGDADANFGTCAYHRPSNSLYWSSSVRGSLFAFKLAYPESDHALSSEAKDDADFLKLLQTTCTVDGRPPRIDHVVEIPSPAPVVSFALEDGASAEDDTFSALIAHPGGIHQIHFKQPRVPVTSASASGTESDSDFADDEAHIDSGRRMSLESAIHVSSEVEIAVDEIDPVAESVSIPDTPALPALGLSQTMLAAVSVEPAVSPVAEEPPSRTDTAETIDRNSTVTPTASATATHAINAAIKTMKAAKKAQAEQQQRTPEIAGRELAPALTSSSKTSTANASPQAPGRYADDVANSSLKEIRKLTTSLPTKIAEMVEAEFEKHVYRLEEQRHVDRVDEKARQESMLKVMSSQLTKHTSKLVEQTLKDELAKLGPIVEKSMQRALSSSMEKTQTGVRKTIQQDVEQALIKSDSLRKLEGQIATEATRQARAEAHEESVKVGLTTLQRSFLDLQKELVKSYTANAMLVETMGKMQSNVLAMQNNLQRLEQTVAALRLGPPAAAPALANTTPTLAASASPLASDSPVSAQLNVVAEDLETKFTEMLQPSQEPDFVELKAFIRKSTPRLLDQIMPPPLSGLKPTISNAVLLSLTLRIGQLVAREEARHSQENAVEGHWLLRCVESLDSTESEIQHYGPKIAEWVTRGLQTRQATLVKLGDIVGTQQIGALVISIKSKLAPLAKVAPPA